jgi:hypothetical protein
MFRNAQDRNAPRCPLDREYICASGRMDIRLSTRYVSLCHTHSAYRRGHTSRFVWPSRDVVRFLNTVSCQQPVYLGKTFRCRCVNTSNHRLDLPEVGYFVRSPRRKARYELCPVMPERAVDDLEMSKQAVLERLLEVGDEL